MKPGDNVVLITRSGIRYSGGLADADSANAVRSFIDSGTWGMSIVELNDVLYASNTVQFGHNEKLKATIKTEYIECVITR